MLELIGLIAVAGAVENLEFLLGEATILLTLAAIAPAIVITILYNFIVQIDLRLQDLKVNEAVHDPEGNYLPVKQFVVISAKLFHLTMVYYLLMLVVSLFTFLVEPGPEADYYLISVGSILFIGYLLWYWRQDVRPSFENHNISQKSWNGFLVTFIVLPLLIPLFGEQLSKPISPFVAWLCIDIAFVLAWWLTVPPTFRPLTRLAKLSG